MAYNTTLEDIEDEISSWGYSMSMSEFERSLQNEPTRVGGRGRGITNPQLVNVRLASDIDNLNAHSFPMGHLPTTEDILACPEENEITPLLRQLGLNSRDDDDMCSKTTRQNPNVQDEIRIDGNIPVILSADLFKPSTADDDEGVRELESFDPERPLHEQFSTIPELVVEDEPGHSNAGSPSKRSKPKKTNITDSSADSGLTADSTSSNQSKKGKDGKGKKKKWRKLTPQEMVPVQPERGRYEEVFSMGIHGTDNGLERRLLYGSDGLKSAASIYSKVP